MSDWRGGLHDSWYEPPADDWRTGKTSRVLVTLSLVIEVEDFDDEADDDASIMEVVKATLSAQHDKYDGLVLSDWGLD